MKTQSYFMYEPGLTKREKQTKGKSARITCEIQ